MKAMRGGLGRLVLTAALVGLSACSRGEATQSAPNAAGGRGGPGRGQSRIPVVQTVPVEIGSIARAVTVSGVVEPLRTEIGRAHV